MSTYKKRGKPVSNNKHSTPKNTSQTPKNTSQTPKNMSQTPKNKKNISKQAVMVIILAVVMIVVLLAVGFIFLTKNTEEKDDPFIYTTPDGGINMVDDKDATTAILSKIQEDMLSYVFSKDNKYILYQTFDLSVFLIEIDSKNAEPVLIAKDVTEDSFFMLDDSKHIVYMRDNGDLLYHDTKEETLILQNVYETIYTQGKTVLFLANKDFDTESKSIYELYSFDFANKDAGSFKVSVGVHGEVFLSSDAKTIIYTKLTDEVMGEDVVDVYTYTGQKDNNIILEDVVLDAVDVDEMTMIYHKKNDTVLDVVSLVTDEHLDGDKDLKMPPDYDVFAKEHGGTEEEIDAAYVVALANYFDKVGRDETREKVDIDSNFTLSDMYLYQKNKPEQLLAEDIYNVYAADTTTKTAVFSTIAIDEMEKVTIADLDKYYWRSLQRYIDETLKISYNVATLDAPAYEVLSTSVKTDQKGELAYITKDGTGAYVLGTETAADELATLYYIDIANKANAVEVATGVTRMLPLGDEFFCLTQTAENTQTLYSVDKNTATKLTENVASNTITLYQASLVYYSNYNADKKSGDLTVYSNGIATQVANNVSDYAWQSATSIYVLKDIDPETGKGSLHKYDGEALNLVDAEVLSIG